MFAWLKNAFGKKEQYGNLDNAWHLRHSQLNTVSTIKVDETTALSLVAVWSAIRVLSEDTASLPFPVYERIEGGGRQRDRSHPVYRLLNDSPDDEITSFQFRETILKSVLTHGNGFAEIERLNDGTPYKLHLLNADKVEPKRTRQGIVYVVDGSTIPAKDMLHVAGLGSGLIGLSPIRYAQQTIAAGLMMDRFASAWFANGSRGSGVITHPGQLTEKAAKNLRESMDAIHGGPENFGKNILLEEGATWNPISIPAEDAQFLATRTFTVQEIARLFRVPCTMLQENSRSTFSNNEQEALNYVKHSLRPWLVRIEQQINFKLFTPEERQIWNAEHLVDGLLRGDAVSRTAALKDQFINGALTLQEWREIENRNPITDPDDHFVPLNMTTLGAIQRSAEAEAEPQEPPQEPEQNANNAPLGAILAARDAVIDTMERAIRRESTALQRAAKKPGEFLQWLDTYYSDHRAFCVTALAPTVKTFLALTEPEAEATERIEQLAELMCADSRETLLDLSGTATGETFSAVIGEQIDKWSRSRSKNLIDIWSKHHE